MGVSASAVGQWENGVTAPTLEKVFALEDLFSTPGELAALLGYGRPSAKSARGEPAASADLPDKIQRLSPRDRRAIERMVDEMLTDE